jgi:CubicO group peptidase (beta-lactamase class C family)
MRRIPVISSSRSIFIFFLLIAACPAGLLQAQSSLPQEQLSKIDRAAQEVLSQTGVPSASVAIVKDGSIVYL